MDDAESTPFWPVGASSMTGDEKPLVASLVEALPGTVGTVIDTKRRRLINVIVALSLVAAVALVASLAVLYTRPGGKLVTVTISPTLSLEPSTSPSSFPSTSPSTELFAFLAERAFDHGQALATLGSPQQMTMDWLNISMFPTLDYHLLQP